MSGTIAVQSTAVPLFQPFWPNGWTTHNLPFLNLPTATVPSFFWLQIYKLLQELGRGLPQCVFKA